MDDDTKSPQPTQAEATPPTDINADDTGSGIPPPDAEAGIIPDKGDETTSADATAPSEETSALMEDDKPGHETEGHEEAAAGESDEASTILPSIEDDHDLNAEEDTNRYSPNPSRRSSQRTEELIQDAARDIMAESDDHDPDHGDDSILDAYNDEDETDRGADSSSQQGVTDEDVFSDGRSPRSSLGSYDGGSESAKHTTVPDNITGATRTPRVLSEVSQYSHYDKDDFVPTTRGHTRPPFRTPSDVRAMQMSSPAPSVIVNSPRSANRKFPTVSRLGSPAGSAQYSPKNRTPSRFKVKQETPLILLHATLLPLRWMWADIIDDLDSSEMSEDAKLLRDSWRLLQDVVGDTVVERGILLGHPQDDYEVLEERLLEALELPMRRRARILECGHYLGPANENGEDDDSDDDYDMSRQQKPQARHHWCNTCKHEIRCESLGPGKIFRVKVYASNGLMKAGAWAACWKEMERVDIELEPVVPPPVQDELVRLAAAREEREAAKQREFDVVSDIVQQIKEEQRDQPSRLQSHLDPSADRRSVDGDRPESVYSRGRSLGGARPESSYSRRTFAEERPESAHYRKPFAEDRPESVQSRRSTAEERRIREEEARIREEMDRIREEEEAHMREPTPEPYYAPSEAASAREPRAESFTSKPSSPSPTGGPGRQPVQTDSLPELLLQSVRVVLRDSKNIIIIVLGVVALVLAVRGASESQRADDDWFDSRSVPRVHIAQVPKVQHVVDTLELPQPMASQHTPIAYTAVRDTQAAESFATYTPSVEVAATQDVPQNTHEVPEVEPSSSVSAASAPCETPMASQEPEAIINVAGEQSQEPLEETEAEDQKEPEIEIVKEKKVVRVIETVTETETVKVTATATATESASDEAPTAIESASDEAPTATESVADVAPTATVEAAAVDEQESTTKPEEPLETTIAEPSNEESSEEEPLQRQQQAESTEETEAVEDTPAAATSEFHDDE
ncbi:hypothetical protein PG999_002690 [Apiospora kogelbergensis]|uniref:Pathway-specific nitrogen regulator n=1 Tax=Apiospora kogelbergensis TaxID=1337665 RepID=A0AAW0R969_9PEZI